MPSNPSAKSTGTIYLFYFLTTIAAVFFMKGIVIRTDAAATAYNIRIHEASFRLGIALGLVAIALYIALTARLYDLFKPVNRNLSLMAAFFSLVGCAIQALATAFQLVPAVISADALSLNAFSQPQLEALSLFLLRFGGQVFNTGLLFFGFYCLLLGYLIFKSNFLPHALGALLALAGAGWLSVLSPHLVITLTPVVQILGFVAEVAFMLWLLVKGVNVSRWQEQSSATPS